MREVYVNQDHVLVGYLKTVLASEGIHTFIRNDHGSSASGLPSPLLFPTLCIVDDADYDRALLALAKVVSPSACDASEWQCARCREEVPGHVRCLLELWLAPGGCLTATGEQGEERREGENRSVCGSRQIGWTSH